MGMTKCLLHIECPIRMVTTMIFSIILNLTLPSMTAHPPRETGWNGVVISGGDP